MLTKDQAATVTVGQNLLYDSFMGMGLEPVVVNLVDLDEGRIHCKESAYQCFADSDGTFQSLSLP